MQPYADRAEAGDALARELTEYGGRDDVVVLGLPRGGIPVAARVAAGLDAPIDALIVRKLGVPWQPELAMGAIAGIGDAIEVVRNESVLRHGRVSMQDFEAILARESDELRRRQLLFRGDRAALTVTGRIVVVVDDGLATGSTMRAAVAALRRQAPQRVVVAAPIGSPNACLDLSRDADAVVCPWQPRQFAAVGQGYLDFTQTTDAEVTALLR